MSVCAFENEVKYKKQPCDEVLLVKRRDNRQGKSGSVAPSGTFPGQIISVWAAQTPPPPTSRTVLLRKEEAL